MQQANIKSHNRIGQDLWSVCLGVVHRTHNIWSPAAVPILKDLYRNIHHRQNRLGVPDKGNREEEEEEALNKLSSISDLDHSPEQRTNKTLVTPNSTQQR